MQWYVVGEDVVVQGREARVETGSLELGAPRSPRRARGAGLPEASDHQLGIHTRRLFRASCL